MIIAQLILHGLLAVALLGAITHQAIGVWPLPTAERFVELKYLQAAGVK
jgi:hypothetical protein